MGEQWRYGKRRFGSVAELLVRLTVDVSRGFEQDCSPDLPEARASCGMAYRPDVASKGTSEAR